MFTRSHTSLVFLLALPALAAPASAFACASCGSTLSSDWESQGFSTHSGLRMDIRYDYLDQNQLRSGTGTISPQAASQVVTPSGDLQEVEKYTNNRYLTLGLDYSFNPDWGVNVQLPYIDRSHATLGTNSDGSNPADGAYDSHTRNIGDVKVVGRYQGFLPRHNLGLLLGLKLATGGHTQTGISTDPASVGAMTAIDRGLQPGTGTTDAIVGLYYFDAINRDWEYFAQGTYQTALNSSDNYKPGDAYSLHAGLRYMGFDSVVPQLQLNTRYARHDSGSNADTVSTGGTLVYLSPGVVVPLNKRVSLYGFVQLPVYQDVNGVQLTPRSIVSVGTRLAF